ncbi:translation initiation factor IF-2 [Lacihabitans sp. CCS-44]|uniref:translation initiation factor IF-2 n=1 Tax=Lacihabitans sp. CCS-44 TaxID=2487331 RepID=UPI0020CE92F9|nr:translation initiation factor IF-2 [Lacihabitans sp. CCS-44]MCP9753563.1 translation initiation factor IF-2 [Lacihabitans sp. CCS-44]
MAEEKMMRLSQAAKKLNVGTITIIEILSSKGHRIDNNPNAKLSFDLLEVLSKELHAPELLGEMGGGSSSVSPTESLSSTRSSDEILYFREEPEEPEIIKIEHNLQGPKVLGKIDLNSKGPAKIIPIDAEPEIIKEEPKVETKPEPVIPIVVEEPTVIAPVIIEVKPAPLVEVKPIEVTKPIEVVPEVVIIKEEIKIEPKIEPKIETPKVETKEETLGLETPFLEKIIDEVFEEKEETPKPKIVIEEDKIEEILPPKLIKAQGDKLQGLKVLGKIELPVERKPLTKEELKQKRKRKRVIVGGEKVGDTTKSNFENFRKDPKAVGPNRPNTPNAPHTPNTGGTKPPFTGGGANVDNKPTTAPNQNQGTGGNTGGKKDFKKGGNRKESVSQDDVKDNIKTTISKMQNKGNEFGSKYRKEKRRNRAEAQDALDQQELEESGTLKVTEFISASELASLMNVTVTEVIASCMKMGIFASINQRLDAETIQMIALEFNFDVEFISAEEEVSFDTEVAIDKEEDLIHRAPIVTIMGHVDHGKTSLLDYIRRSKVASGEAGGITQHIGAYSVTIKEGDNKGKSITFLDTPGHEAFTAMRARGAKVTDVVIIVISADDSVMPQTKEAINHAQNAGVPIVFAFNKIDKPNANPAKIREDLAKENILVESWGGKYQEQEVSAKSGIGIDELLDKVLLEAELLELKANPNRNSFGTVIEASLDKGRGYVSTILVENGTLKIGDIMLAGQYFGRVKALVNSLGERVKEAGPSQPVQILGLPGAPQAGDKFNIMESDREAREIANKREQLNREMSIRAKKHITLDEIGRRKAIGTFKELNVIVKGDVDGSVEALSDSLLKLSTDEVQVNIVHKAVGQISESDVTLASAADAIVIGFQVRPSNNARKIADAEQIEIRLYSIIYDAINEIKAAMEGMLAPKEEEVVTGNIQVREVFKISKVGTIAGCYVTDGYVKRNNKVRIIREGIVVHEGEIAQLKRFKDDVAEVKNGYECGLSIKNFNDIMMDDIIESFEIRELKRTL